MCLFVTFVCLFVTLATGTLLARGAAPNYNLLPRRAQQRTRSQGVVASRPQDKHALICELQHVLKQLPPNLVTQWLAIRPGTAPRIAARWRNAGIPSGTNATRPTEVTAGLETGGAAPRIAERRRDADIPSGTNATRIPADGTEMLEKCVKRFNV